MPAWRAAALLLLAIAAASPYRAVAEGRFSVAQFDYRPDIDPRRLFLRDVTVNFVEVRMLSDSDAGGKCECRFHFKVDNEPHIAWLGPGIGSGERIKLRPGGNRMQITVQTAADSVLIYVAGEDEDGSRAPGLITGRGSNSERDWASASARVAIPEPGVMQTWQIPAFNGVVGGEHGRLHFVITGTIFTGGGIEVRPP